MKRTAKLPGHLTLQEKVQMMNHVNALTSPVLDLICSILEKHNLSVLVAVGEVFERTKAAERHRDDLLKVLRAIPDRYLDDMDAHTPSISLMIRKARGES